jgi:hypothetical protein
VDIREAEFSFEPDLHHIPGGLIRIDKETQAVVRRSAFKGVSLDDLDWGKSAIALAVEWFLEESPYDDAVVAAGRRSKTFKRDRAALAVL